MGVYRRRFALKPFGAPLPSLCHAGPSGLVVRIMSVLGHAFALSGMFQKFISRIKRHIFHLRRAK
jgi:hypothetical protein